MIDYSPCRGAAVSRQLLSRHLTTFLDSRAISSRPALHTTNECVISRLRYQLSIYQWKMIISISGAVNLQTWADGLCIILQAYTLSLSCCTTLVPGQTRLCTFISYLCSFVVILFRVPSTCFMLYLDIATRQVYPGLLKKFFLTQFSTAREPLTSEKRKHLSNPVLRFPWALPP